MTATNTAAGLAGDLTAAREPGEGKRSPLWIHTPFFALHASALRVGRSPGPRLWSGGGLLPVTSGREGGARGRPESSLGSTEA